MDLRNRETVPALRDRVYLDKHVRVPPPRAMARLTSGSGRRSSWQHHHSGGETCIGEFCLIAGGVNINASRHGTAREAYVKEQPHTHGQVEIGNDVWIGSGASIVIVTRGERVGPDDGALADPGVDDDRGPRADPDVVADLDLPVGVRLLFDVGLAGRAVPRGVDVDAAGDEAELADARLTAGVDDAAGSISDPNPMSIAPSRAAVSRTCLSR